MQTLTIDSKLPKAGTTIFTTMSKKASEHKAINLGQGFPDFDADPKLTELAANYVMEGKNQYCPLAGLPKLNKVLCEKIERMYGRKLDPESNICITSGATQALFTAVTAFVNAGDEVIIFEPAYDCYKPEIILAGGKPVPYTMKYPDYAVDWSQVEDMVNDRTRMIIINSPHNPTGTIFRKSDIEALEHIVKARNIVVLSDEVYEHLIYDGEEHQSVLRYPHLFEQAMAVFSFGKTLSATGWKLGYIVGPDRLISEFKAIHQWNVFCANSFLQFTIADYLSDPSHYEYLPGFFQEKRDLMNELFADLPLQPVKSKGTYFQLYDYSEVSQSNDGDFAIELIEKYGVASIPVSPFYTTPPGDKVVRFCFAKKKETLEKAAEALY